MRPRRQRESQSLAADAVGDQGSAPKRGRGGSSEAMDAVVRERGGSRKRGVDELRGGFETDLGWLPSESLLDAEDAPAGSPAAALTPPMREKRHAVDDEAAQQPPPVQNGEVDDDDDRMSWEGSGYARVESERDSQLLRDSEYAQPNFMLRRLTLDRLGRVRK